MYLSLSAGGSPDAIRSSLTAQANAQLGTAATPEQQAVADAIVAHVGKELEGADSASVSVTVGVGVTRFTSPPATAAAT